VTQPSIGDLVYLASYLIRLRTTAQTTAPDTPNQYGADLAVMGDEGSMSTDALAGPPGPGGQQQFAFRRQDDLNVNSPSDLPTNLQDIPSDVGRYWLIDTLDSEGLVTTETAWTWYGTGWRTFIMGVKGPPGPTPAIQVSQELIPPGQVSYVNTGATSIEPSWQLNLAQPFGPSGPLGPLWLFPDVDTSTPAVANDLLEFGGSYNTAGQPVWKPYSIGSLLPGPYSMPESAFTAYTGVSQQALIGSMTIPAQTYDWTPVVWGHIGLTGANLSAHPFMIGAQVLLGDAVTGTQISRGLGNVLGQVPIFPHYSTTDTKTTTITPTNQYALVKAGQTATLHVNLWNDGYWGIYSYTPGGSQLFAMVTPVNIGGP
jgi:hypothetical protein